MNSDFIPRTVKEIDETGIRYLWPCTKLFGVPLVEIDNALDRGVDAVLTVYGEAWPVVLRDTTVPTVRRDVKE